VQKTILITGANRGIGFALTKQFLDKNNVVIGASRSGKVLGLGQNNFHDLTLDLNDPKSIEEASNSIASKFGSIDVLINNAGIGPDLKTQEPSLSTFNDTFGVNVSGTVFLTEALIPMISENGLIINISSKMGSVASCQLSDSVAYRMSKSALNMYTKILFNRLQSKVKVVAIHPGWVKTNIAEGNFENARLTAQESAERILRFLESDFKTATFWDCEQNKILPW